MLYVGDEAEKQALLLGEPDLFFTTPAYDGLPLVMLRLARVNTARLRELVTDAWRMRAPDQLLRDLDGGAGPTDPGPRQANVDRAARPDQWTPDRGATML